MPGAQLAQKVIVSDLQFPSGRSVMAEAFSRNREFLLGAGASVVDGVDAFAAMDKLRSLGITRDQIGVVVWGSPHGHITDGGTGASAETSSMTNSAFTHFAFNELREAFDSSVVLVPYPAKYGCVPIDRIEGRLVQTLRMRGYEPLASIPDGYAPLCGEHDVFCACAGDGGENVGELDMSETIRRQAPKVTLFLGEMCGFLSSTVVARLLSSPKSSERRAW